MCIQEKYKIVISTDGPKDLALLNWGVRKCKHQTPSCGTSSVFLIIAFLLGEPGHFSSHSWSLLSMDTNNNRGTWLRRLCWLIPQCWPCSQIWEPCRTWHARFGRDYSDSTTLKNISETSWEQMKLSSWSAVHQNSAHINYTRLNFCKWKVISQAHWINFVN